MEQFFWFKSSFPPGDPETNPKKNNFSTGVIISAIPGSLVFIYIYIGYIPTPLTVNKMVCFYILLSSWGSTAIFMIFLCFYLVVFLVRSYVFLHAFSGAVFPCFLSCFFWCLLVILLVVFFVLFLVLFSLCSGVFFRVFFRACPLSFLYTFPLGGGPVFCRVFFRGFWVFFPCFFSCFLWCFFCVFYRVFFRAFFRFVSRIFFRVLFFRALGGTRDKQPQYFAFWPVLFSVLFLVVTTSEDRIYTTYIYI